MKTISIKPASEGVAGITIHDDRQADETSAADEQMPFLCSADELNESLRRTEKEFSQGKTGGLTSAQMKEKHAL